MDAGEARDPPDFWSGKRAWDLPRRNRFRVLAVAGSPDDRASSPAHDDGDDDGAAVAVDATAVASDAAAVAADVAADVAAAEVAAAVAADVAAAVADIAAVAVGTDTGTGIGIGTAATGTGIGMGDWAGVFGAAALPGPAVPYRWDDMYHQKPGLAVCLHVVSNHFVPSFIRHRSSLFMRLGAAEQLSRLPHVFLLCVWTHRIYLFLCLFLSFFFYPSTLYSVYSLEPISPPIVCSTEMKVHRPTEKLYGRDEGKENKTKEKREEERIESLGEESNFSRSTSISQIDQRATD